MAENLNYTSYSPGYLATEKFGVLYTFNSALRSCPDGWHLPTVAEWEELKEYYPDNLSLRSGEFNAKVSGWAYDGERISEGYVAVWWSSEEYNYDYAWVYLFVMGELSGGDLSRTNFYKTNMVCVRCVKDN